MDLGLTGKVALVTGAGEDHSRGRPAGDFGRQLFSSPLTVCSHIEALKSFTATGHNRRSH